MIITICLRAAFTELVNAVPGAVLNGDQKSISILQPFLSIAPIPHLDQKDYLLIKFWCKSDYTKAKREGEGISDLTEWQPQRGGARAAKGENVAMWFVEFADGTIIYGFRAMAICDKSRSIFHQVVWKGMAPETWMKVNNKTGMVYRSEMAFAFPELQFCELDWKAQQIAIDNYPNFNHKAASLAITIKSKSSNPSLTHNSKKHLCTDKDDRKSTKKVKKGKNEDNNNNDNDSIQAVVLSTALVTLSTTPTSSTMSTPSGHCDMSPSGSSGTLSLTLSTLAAVTPSGHCDLSPLGSSDAPGLTFSTSAVARPSGHCDMSPSGSSGTPNPTIPTHIVNPLSL